MMLDNGMVFGLNCRLSGSSTKTVNQLIETPIYKRKTIIDKYNELTFNFKDGFKLVFRAYDEGIAYRFISTLKKPFKVKDEQAVLIFLLIIMLSFLTSMESMTHLKNSTLILLKTFMNMPNFQLGKE